jgi:hypothetical protein
MNLEATTRGGGFATMNVLHAYDVRNEQKGLLSGYSVTPFNILALLYELNCEAEELETSHNLYIEGAVTTKTANAYERNPNPSSSPV